MVTEPAIPGGNGFDPRLFGGSITVISMVFGRVEGRETHEQPSPSHSEDGSHTSGQFKVGDESALRRR